MASQTHVQGSTLSEITQSIARLKSSGTPADRIVSQLMERGWPETSARQFVANVRSGAARGEGTEGADGEAARARDRAAGRGGAERGDALSITERREEARYYRLRTLRGLVCFVMGLAIIVVSLCAVDPYEGLFLFAVGVLLCTIEAIDFLWGVMGWWRNRG